MRTIGCACEDDVFDAVGAGRWPARVDEPLRAHVVGCAICADLVVVAAALALEGEMASHEAQTLPSADLVWWRAQMRARADAARTASRPILWIQAMSVACAAGVIGGIVGTLVWWLRSWGDWLAGAARVAQAAAGDVAMAGFVTRGIVLAVAVWLVITPVAVYLAADE